MIVFIFFLFLILLLNQRVSRGVSFFHEIVGCPQRIDLRERVVRFVEVLLYQVLLDVRFQYDHTCQTGTKQIQNY